MHRYGTNGKQIRPSGPAYPNRWYPKNHGPGKEIRRPHGPACALFRHFLRSILENRGCFWYGYRIMIRFTKRQGVIPSDKTCQASGFIRGPVQGPAVRKPFRRNKRAVPLFPMLARAFGSVIQTRRPPPESASDLSPNIKRRSLSFRKFEHTPKTSEGAEPCCLRKSEYTTCLSHTSG